MSQTYKILFADDEYWIREKMKHIIQWEEYDFDFLDPAVDGKDALEKVKTEKPDILITDIDMPFINGVQLIEQVRHEHEEMVIFVISGYDDFAYVKEAMKNDAIDYLLKPINKLTLVETLSKALEIISKQKEDHNKSLKAASLIQDREMSFFLNNNKNAKYSPSMNQVNVNGQGMILVKVHKLNRMIDAFNYEINQLSFYIKNRIRQAVGDMKVSVFNNIYRANEFIILTDQNSAEQHRISIKVLNGLSSIIDPPLSIMISNMSFSMETMNSAYVQCVSLMMQRPFNENNVIVYSSEETLDTDMSDQVMTEETKKHLIAYLNSGNKDQVRSLLLKNMGLSRFQDERWSYLMIKQVVKRVSSVVTDYIFTNNRSEEMPEIEYLLELIERHIDNFEIGEVGESIDELMDIVILDKETEIQGSVREVARIAAEYINKNYFEKLTLVSIAKKYNVESSYFSKVFHEELGVNIMLYIANKRMEKAKELMVATKTNMAEIAFMVGYDDYTYFSKVFKKMTGMSPRKYRTTFYGGDHK